MIKQNSQIPNRKVKLIRSLTPADEEKEKDCAEKAPKKAEVKLWSGVGSQGLYNRKPQRVNEDTANHLSEYEHLQDVNEVSLTRRTDTEKRISPIKMDTNGSIYGYIGLILIIFSLVTKPYYFAMASYFLGIVSYTKEAYAIGLITISLAILSLFVQYFLGISWF